jgi:uncharacterized protein YjbJ (UPF0337 family)
MDWNRIEGNWKETKGKVKEKWGQLTDDDLTQVNGQRDHSKARFSSATASPRIWRARTSTIG